MDSGGEVMGWYGEHVLPRLIDSTCGMAVFDPDRERTCAGLAGDVVEIGFGSGLNVGYYPEAVRSVAAVEPSDLAWRLAEPRRLGSTVRITRSGLVGESLALPDDSADAALSTWTMCTIPDLPAALSELRRVLRPGGALHFLEHGLAPDEPVRRWQRRFEPVQRRVAGGCHLTRRIADQVEDAGFRLTEVDAYYADGVPKFFGAVTLGVAVSAP